MPTLRKARRVGQPRKCLTEYVMSNHNNLRPRHMPVWLGITLLCVIWVAAILIQEHFHLVAGWFTVVKYIVLLFAATVFSLRPAWGRGVFWLTVGFLLGFHTLAGCLLLILVPKC